MLARERGDTCRNRAPEKGRGMGPRAQGEGLGFGRSRVLPQEYQQVAGEWVGAGRWAGLLEATPRPHLTDFSFPREEVSRPSAVDEGSRDEWG